MTPITPDVIAKHGITPQNYQQYFGHLGTADQLHR